MSASQKHSSNWLTVVPSLSLGLSLQPREFCVMILYQLGLPIFSQDGPCSACGTPNSDRLGDHAFSCGVSGECIARHNALHNTIFQIAQSANLALRKEEALAIKQGQET